MQKTRNRSDASNYETRHPRRSVVPPPEVVNIDVLGVMKDEDLIDRRRALEEDRNRAYEAHGETRAWEVELAYIRREQELRRTRRENHANYVRTLEEEMARSELGLRDGDFDNSAFVYAATGGRPTRWN